MAIPHTIKAASILSLTAKPWWHKFIQQLQARLFDPGSHPVARIVKLSPGQLGKAVGGAGRLVEVERHRWVPVSHWLAAPESAATIRFRPMPPIQYFRTIATTLPITCISSS